MLARFRAALRLLYTFQCRFSATFQLLQREERRSLVQGHKAGADPIE